MADSGIIIRHWDRLQHFKDRDPIWIKLYRALRHNRRWRQLSGDGCKLYIDLMLLASEDEPYGTIHLNPAELGWEVRLDPMDELMPLLLEVAAAGLITVVGYQPDIKQITAGDQEDIPHALARGREEGEVEVEKETTNGRDTKRFLYLDTVEWSRFGKDFGINQTDLDRTLGSLRQ